MLHGATLSQRLCHLLLSGKSATGDEQDWAAALIKRQPLCGTSAICGHQAGGRWQTVACL